MMLLGSCEKHGNSAIEHRISWELIKKINNREYITPSSIIVIKLSWERYTDKFIMNQEFISENNYPIEQVFETEEELDKEVNFLMENYLGGICIKCLIEYQKKFETDLLKLLS